MAGREKEPVRIDWQAAEGLEKAPTATVRDMYRTACERLGIEGRWIGKMGRPELLKKARALLTEGRIVLVPAGGDGDAEDAEDAEDTEAAPADPGFPSGIRHPLNQKADDALHSLLEALRLYLRREIWISAGRKDDPQTKVYLKDAQERVREAVGQAIDLKGGGWDKAARLAYYIDRALMKLRLDFTETLASNCVLCALLSEEKNQAAMKEALR